MKWINQDKLVRFSKNTRSKDVRSELEVLSYSHESFGWTDTITIFDYALVFILFLPNSDFFCFWQSAYWESATQKQNK